MGYTAVGGETHSTLQRNTDRGGRERRVLFYLRIALADKSEIYSVSIIYPYHILARDEIMSIGDSYGYLNYYTPLLTAFR